MLLVSPAEHCLNDLLYRHRASALPMDITAIVANHRELAHLAEWHAIPYHYLPVTAATKPEQERQILERVEQTGTELVVLARYMQILSPELCRALAGRAINIHHSFLPGFKGAKPYHQAYTRGAVSYTHLDVYKRQVCICLGIPISSTPWALRAAIFARSAVSGRLKRR